MAVSSPPGWLLVIKTDHKKIHRSPRLPFPHLLYLLPSFIPFSSLSELKLGDGEREENMCLSCQGWSSRLELSVVLCGGNWGEVYGLLWDTGWETQGSGRIITHTGGKAGAGSISVAVFGSKTTTSVQCWVVCLWLCVCLCVCVSVSDQYYWLCTPARTLMMLLLSFLKGKHLSFIKDWSFSATCLQFVLCKPPRASTRLN